MAASTLAVFLVIVLLNCVVLINSAVLNRSSLRRLLQSSTKVCPKIAKAETDQALRYSLCPAEVTVNLDESRIPQRIQEVQCVANPETCDFCHKSHRCVQVTAIMDVYYLKRANGNEIIPTPESLTYNSACICADLPAQEAGEIVQRTLQ